MPHIPSILHADTWLRIIVSHPLRFIFLTAVVTAAFAWQLPDLRFQTSIYGLTIHDLPETIRYQELRSQFGCEEIILVVARTSGVFDPDTFSRLTQLADELETIKGIQRVISLPGIKDAMDLTGQWDLAEFEDVISPVDLFTRNLISEDKKTTVLSLIIEDIDGKDGIIEDVQEILSRQPQGLVLYQIGMPVVSKSLADFVQLDFLRLPPLTLVSMLVILLVLFRSLRGVLIPAVAVSIALTWTFGLMAWTDTPLSMLTMVVPVFLIAVGTAYCMYIFPGYLAACRTQNSSREAAYACFQDLRFPSSLAVITTTIGLGSLLLNRIDAIQEFALFACFGILSMLVLLLGFLPALLALLPLPKEKEVNRFQESPVISRIIGLVLRINLRHQKWTFAIVIAMAVAGAVGISRLEVETNPVSFFKSDSDVSRHFHDVARDLAGSFPVNVVIEGPEADFFEDPKHLRALVPLLEFLGSLNGVDKAISVLDYFRLVNFATNNHDPKAYKLPEEPFEVRMLVNSFKTMLGEDLLHRFISPDFSRINVMLRTHLSSSRDFLATEQRIQEYLTTRLPRELSGYPAGFGIAVSKSSELLTRGQVESLSLTFILLFCIMFLLFISYKVGLIGMVPNCFPILITFGFMGWLGQPLSMVTSLIASIAIGLAVDDTIHYLVRYNREFKKDLDRNRALQQTIQEMGKPILFTTLTISVGFSILMFSNFTPTALFGLLMVITMFSAVIADLIILPSLMLHVELITLWDLLKLKMGKDPEKGIPLFNGLSRTQVHYILMAGALREYGQGDVVFRKGEISESMYAVISGKLEVLDPAETPEADAAPPENTFPRHIATLAPGDVVGEMGMIRSCERSATVVASTPAELIQINERMLKRLQWLFPPTAHKFFFNLMGQLCDRVQRMTECYLGSGIIDPVTGLHTRSHVLSVLDREVRCAVRYQTPLSLFLLNLASDSLQSEPLHCEGQPPLLLEIGKRLRGVLSPADPVCRYTACRFAGVLHLDTQATTEICRRLSAAITERPVQLDDREHHLKVHIGITTLDPHRDLHRQGGFDPLAVASQALEEAIRTDATEPVLRTEIL